MRGIHLNCVFEQHHITEILLLGTIQSRALLTMAKEYKRIRVLYCVNKFYTYFNQICFITLSHDFHTENMHGHICKSIYNYLEDSLIPQSFVSYTPKFSFTFIDLLSRNDDQSFYSSQGVVHLITTTIDTFKDRFMPHVDDLLSNVVVFLVCSLLLLISMFFSRACYNRRTR